MSISPWKPRGTREISPDHEVHVQEILFQKSKGLGWCCAIHFVCCLWSWTGVTRNQHCWAGVGTHGSWPLEASERTASPTRRWGSPEHSRLCSKAQNPYSESLHLSQRLAILFTGKNEAPRWPESHFLPRFSLVRKFWFFVLALVPLCQPNLQVPILWRGK